MKRLNDLTKALKTYLFNNDMSPLEFSRESHVAQATISRILNLKVKRINTDTKKALGDFFGIPFSRIEGNPFLILEDSGDGLLNRTAKQNLLTIPLYDQNTVSIDDINGLNNKESNNFIPVSPDIDQDCFAIKVTEKTAAPYIESGDTIILKPIYNLNDMKCMLNKKYVFIRVDSSKLEIMKVIIDDDIFLKNMLFTPKIVQYNEGSHHIIAWVTEIRKKIY